MLKTEKRGGARPGSGRKPSPNKKIQVATRLSPEVVEILRNSDIPIAQYIELAVIGLNEKLKFDGENKQD